MMEQEYKYMVCTQCFTFNHAPYIVDAMNGFTMQETSFPVVMLIVDDASTDGEQEVIRQYLTEHFQEPYRTDETEYAHIICAQHKSNTYCEFVVVLLKYNHYSIKKPKRPYLSEWLDNSKYHALCEGDDYWIHPEKLQRQVDFLEKHPTFAMSYTRSRHKDQESGKLSDGPLAPYKGFEGLLKRNYIETLTVVVRAQVYNDYYKEINPAQYHWVMGDYPLWLYVAANHDVHYLPEITSVYRMHQGSASRPSDFKVKKEFLQNNIAIQHMFAKIYNMPKDVIQVIDYKANYNLALAHLEFKKYKEAFPYVIKLRIMDILKCIVHAFM